MLFVASGIGAAQNAAHPGDWKTWVIRSGSEHGVGAPPDAGATQAELQWLRSFSKENDPAIVQQIRYWDAGPPTYRWMDTVASRFSNSQALGAFPLRAFTWVSLAMYDATVAAENAKRTYARPRPTAMAGGGIEARVAVPQSSSYPSDYAATAAAAATVLAYLIPAEAEHFHMLAEQAGKSRLYAGVELPSDYFAGMELGKRVAEQVIAKARMDGSAVPWSGTVPTGACRWTGTNPGNVSVAAWTPLLLSSPSEFRPAPPPACDSAEVQAQLATVKNTPRALATNFATNSKAFYWQTLEGNFSWAFTHLNRWIMEDQMERNPAAAARAYALLGATGFDAYIASQDGKYAYWYPRPAQVDPTLAPLFPAPNFPSYPSNHAIYSISRAEVLAYLFPDRADFIRAQAKEASDSRVWAGIHFPMDTEVGVKMGHQIAQKFIAWAENDGSQGR